MDNRPFARFWERMWQERGVRIGPVTRQVERMRPLVDSEFCRSAETALLEKEWERVRPIMEGGWIKR